MPNSSEHLDTDVMRRQRSDVDYYRKLRKNYSVVIEAKLPTGVADGLAR